MSARPPEHLIERLLYGLARRAVRLSSRLYPQPTPVPYDGCHARPGTWGAMSEVPYCCEPKGHAGPHVDPALIYRWYEPVVITWPQP